MTYARNTPFVLIIMVTCAQGVMASPCVAPERPYLPSSPDAMRTYADLLRADFESYIGNVQDYFLCLDEERARAFVEAREVSEDYGRFVSVIE